MSGLRLGGIELLAQSAADDAYRTAMRWYDLALGTTPIERLFCTSLMVVAAQRHRWIERIYRLRESSDLTLAQDTAARMDNVYSTAFIEAQVHIAGWRVDFLIHYPAAKDWHPGQPLSRVLIECDGHDFHERTKQQAARDRSRDRAAQHAGIPILRFTGSEIWNDPCACADEVLAFMERE